MTSEATGLKSGECQVLSSNNGDIPAPVSERDDSILVQDLTCALCHEISMQPTTTPCEHLFCLGCIESALQYNEVCPNCREPLHRQQLEPLSGILHRVWENIQVQCPQRACKWRGCLASYINHAKSKTCSSHLLSSDDKSNDNAQEKLDDMERKISELSSKVSDLTTLLGDVQDTLSQTRSQRDQDLEKMRDMEKKFCDMYDEISTKTNQLNATRGQLQNSKERLNKLIESQNQQRATGRPLLDTSYNYDRSRVVELAQLICCDLESKPKGTDRNRIFNCVRQIHRYYKSNAKEKPKFFHHDVKMLLSICNATSDWFSENQLETVDKWLGEM